MVQIPILCKLEVRDREKFQADGHYVVSTITGPNVYILTYSSRGQQLLRVQGQSQAQATVAMSEAFPTTLYALWAQEKIQDGIQQEFRRQNEERNKLSEFIHAHYARELQGTPTTATVINIAIDLLTRERSRLSVRLWNWLTRANRSHRGGYLQPPPSAPYGDGV